MGVRVVVADGESVGAALRRLRKQVESAGVSWKVRWHSYFVDGTELRRAKRFRKRFRVRQAALLARVAAGLTGPSLEEAKAAFWRRTGKP